MRKFWIKGAAAQTLFSIIVTIFIVCTGTFLIVSNLKPTPLNVVLLIINAFLGVAAFFVSCHYFQYGAIFTKRYAQKIVGKTFTLVKVDAYNPVEDKFMDNVRKINIHRFENNQLVFDENDFLGKRAWPYKLLLFKLANDGYELEKED